ncbi:MAG: hypothetical protein ACR5KV_01045 [Wolbachia sp.]
MNSSDIKRVVNEPKFSDLKFTDSLLEKTKDTILKLIEQNKEVLSTEKLYIKLSLKWARV